MSNIVVVCSPMVDIEALKPVFKKYSNEYMFELENIRKNQELVCNIIYMASSAKFLKLNNKCFVEEIIYKIKLSLEEEERMKSILNLLTEKGFHKEIHQLVRSLVSEK